MVKISTVWCVQELPRPQELGFVEQGSRVLPAVGINSTLCGPLSQRLAGKRQPEHLAFGNTQLGLMLLRRQADTGLQLWVYDEIFFSQLSLPCCSLSLHYPPTPPQWQLGHCSYTIPLLLQPKSIRLKGAEAPPLQQSFHAHQYWAPPGSLKEYICSKVCEPRHGRLVVHRLQMRPVGL